MRRMLQWTVVAVAMACAGVMLPRAALMVWPWTSWVVGVLLAVIGCAITWGIGAWFICRAESRSHPTAVGVCIAKSSEQGWLLEVVRVDVIDDLARLGVVDTDDLELDERDKFPGKSPEEITEETGKSTWETPTNNPVKNKMARRASVQVQPAAALGFVATLTVLIFSLGVWRAWHPDVRLVNFTEKHLEIRVDGRRVAVLVPTPTESPGVGTNVSLMTGRRLFEAYTLDGTRVDRSAGRVGTSGQLYAPLIAIAGSSGVRSANAEGKHDANSGEKQPKKCFWIEQRAYGKAHRAALKPQVLSSPNRFFSLPSPVDAWFQPNPPAPRSAWFSGGVRRALRQGPCSAIPK